MSLSWSREGGKEAGSSAGGRAGVHLQKSGKGKAREGRGVLGTCELQDPHADGILVWGLRNHLDGARGLRNHLTDGETEAQMSRTHWLKLRPPKSLHALGWEIVGAWF